MEKNENLQRASRDKNDKRKVTHYFFKFSPILSIGQYEELKGIAEYPGDDASIEKIIEYQEKSKIG